MLCKKCGAFLASEGSPVEVSPVEVSCHKCDDHHYDKAAALGVYEKGLAASVLELKNVPHLAERVRTFLEAASATPLFDGIDLLIPVPLSRLRMHERGYNQADLIADAISRINGIPTDKLSLARKVHTQMHRVGMDQKARELTTRNAFELKRPKLIAGKNVMLIDDVLTSGATASQAAKVLKKNGAVRVNVFTLARAVLR